MIEGLAFGLAVTAAKAVFSLWATGSVGTDVAFAAGDVVSTSLADEKDRRAAKRQIDGMAERIFEQIEPLFSAENRTLSDGEVSLIVESVQAAVSMSNTTARLVVENDFDSLKLEAAIRPSDQAYASLGLSEEGEGLYNLLLGECCDYITEIAARLPRFETEAAREILRREASLMDLAQATFVSMPRSRVPRSFGVGDDHERFETRYVRAIATYAEKLELFGVTSVTARRPYDLSVAYISLSIAGVGDPNATLPAGDDSTFEPDGDLSRADAYFGEHSRVLLTGDAGSGKTTLLRWLAGLAARDSPMLEEAGTWRQRIPFIIPLRQFADSPLPTPGMFVNVIKPNLAEATPPGWAHHILESGRAALLVDGLDEVPADRRGQVLEWLVELDRDFPNNSILVTSRGAALTQEWQNSELLDRATLQPMNPSDIQSFVNHWHDAMRRSALIDERQQVSDAHAGMLNVIKSRPNIRALSKTPLLCALMCALHLENASSLPTDKMGLYRTAIEMLVMKRDNDRRLARSDTQLNLSDRLVLLQRLAVWMHENGLADVSHEEYEASISRTLVTLNRPADESQSTAAFMLERCGILREPTPGHVDFIHRSFLEYLAAAAEVEDDSIKKLLLHATEETWREVIIMAAGHANNSQRRQLIEGLLARGSEEASNRHQLFLTAVATLETVRFLDPDLRADLQNALNQVLPPVNMTEASAVASAGASAAPLLKRRPKLGVLEAVASVRALALIGGPEAFDALKSYKKETRVTVIRQIIRAWMSFDVEEYATEILADSPFVRGGFEVTEPAQVPHVAKFTRLESVTVSITERLTGWAELSPLEGDERVDAVALINQPWAVDLQGLPAMPGVKSLRISDFSDMRSVRGIGELRALEEVQLMGVPLLADLTALVDLPNLRVLTVSASRNPDLSFLSRFSRPLKVMSLYASEAQLAFPRDMQVESLNIAHWTWRADATIINLDGLGESSQIKSLRLDCTRLPGVVNLPPHLEMLHLQDDSASFGGGASLKEISLHERPSPSVYRLIDVAQGLARLSVSADVSADDVKEMLQRLPARIGFTLKLLSYVDVADMGEEPVQVAGCSVDVNYGTVVYSRHG